MDVDMPGISGIETCRRLRARDDAADVPVLIVTGLTTRRPSTLVLRRALPSTSPSPLIGRSSEDW